MRAHGAYTALVSGGFSFFTARVATLCRVRYAPLQHVAGRWIVLIGTRGRTDPRSRYQAGTLTQLPAQRGLPLSATLAVGDGANDLDMLSAAGLGVAFRAKPIVAAAAQARVDHADLRALLFAQGYRARQFVVD